MLQRPPRGPATRRDPRCFAGDRRLPLFYRSAPDSERTTSNDPSYRDEKLARLEAALFAAEEPLAARKLAQVADLADVREVKKLLDRLRQRYAADESSFQIDEVAGGYQLFTQPEFHPWLVRLKRTSGNWRLSGPALETLAIVAYRQPIVRADIENIRGVQCAEILIQLLEKGIIKIAGRHESLGRPVLYGTTKKFLQWFGLNSLADLPEVEQLKPPKG